jgi:hypothetical protein
LNVLKRLKRLWRRIRNAFNPKEKENPKLHDILRQRRAQGLSIKVGKNPGNWRSD